jgi:peptide/nickel transport system permease protein
MSVSAALPSRRRFGIRRLQTDWLTVLCLLVIGIAVAAALLAPVLAPYDPNFVDFSAINQGPTVHHLLGTDGLGRDMLSRLMWGARTSLLGPLLVVTIGTVAATVLALTAAWQGGIFDSMVAATINLIFGFPGLLLAMLAVAVFGTGLTAPVIALGIAYTPYIARVCRAAALRERNMPYIDALTVQGFGTLTIIWRHLLPNLRSLILAQATLSFGYATIDLAALSFLGLGVQPPTPDWGLMVAQGQGAIIAHEYLQVFEPCAALVLVVLSVTFLGRRIARLAGDEL